LDIRTNGADGLCWRWPALGIARWRSMSGAPTGRIVDSCGAGDWLTAGILVGIRGLGWPDGVPAVERILRQAQGLAAWSCGFAGAKGALYEAGPSAARRHAGGETRDATATAVDPLLERAMDASQCCVSCSPSPSWSARPAF
jgi:fructokinase